MSNDTAECGCEGHAENFDACKYPALLERMKRLETMATGVADGMEDAANHGDLIAITSRLRWWAREMREALKP